MGERTLQVIAPKFAEIADQNADTLVCLKVNVDENEVSGCDRVKVVEGFFATMQSAVRSMCHENPCLSLVQEIAKICNISAMPTFQVRQVTSSPYGVILLVFRQNCTQS
jgi:hypothetical protein